MKEAFKFSGSPNIVTPVMEERVILVAYQDGSWFDKLIVHYVRKRNPKVERLYQAHLQAVRDVRTSGGEIFCPDELSDRLLDIAGQAESSTKEVPVWVRQWRNILHALQAGTVVAVTAALAIMVVNHLNTPSINQQELEQATLEAKASLALISEIMNGTANSMSHDVLIEQTARPINKSIFKGTETIKENL